MRSIKRKPIERTDPGHPSALVETPRPAHSTRLSAMFCADSAQLLRAMPDEPVDFV